MKFWTQYKEESETKLGDENGTWRGGKLKLDNILIVTKNIGDEKLFLVIMFTEEIMENPRKRTRKHIIWYKQIYEQKILYTTVYQK